MAADALTAIRGDQLPLVMLDSDPKGSLGAATVNLDIADGVRQVADHLLTLGHRHFLHLAADIPSWTFEARARELAARVGAVTGTSVRTTRAPISIDGALKAAEAALADPGARATAVVCDDDKLAAGAPTRPPAASACASPTTSRSPASTTWPSPPPSTRNSPPCASTPNSSANTACAPSSPSWTAAHRTRGHPGGTGRPGLHGATRRPLTPLWPTNAVRPGR